MVTAPRLRATPSPGVIALGKHGYTLSTTSRMVGCTVGHLSRVLAGERPMTTVLVATLHQLGGDSLVADVIAAGSAAPSDSRGGPGSAQP